ncbi:MAG TPA: ATP-binding protein [Lacunisphaera sp.]|nr:ATP-binding protein [Lacunisphaera sp.]
MARPTSKPAADAAVIAALPDPAIITSDAWENGGATMAFANPEFCALTGYTAAELQGKNTRLLHGPRTDVAGLRQPRPTGPAAGGEGEAWLYRKDGTEFFARWKYRPLAGAAPGGVVAVYHDCTELWRQREALLQSQKVGTVGLLAGGVAHDFNNLLSVINGYCEILGPKIESVPAAAKDLREIHRAGLKASAIARQILEFSRRQEADTGVVNFNTLIREITEIIRRVCGDAIEVEVRLASDLGNARINPVHFQQVLLNLCFNARDAMPEGGRLTLRTCNQLVPANAGPGGPPAGPCVMLQVIDTGIGLEPGEVAKIFEPFYTTKPQGTGLGLPTSLAIIRHARGDILVRSTPRQGTTFEVYLPETAEPEDTSPTTLGVLPSTQGTEAVLVIERDDGLRRMITGILAIDGYSATEASSVEAAAQPGARPQLVIIDSGAAPAVEFLRKLHRGNRGLRVICTAPVRPNLAGFSDQQAAHLPKPFALSSLLTKVRAMLDAKAE